MRAERDHRRVDRRDALADRQAGGGRARQRVAGRGDGDRPHAFASAGAASWAGAGGMCASAAVTCGARASGLAPPAPERRSRDLRVVQAAAGSPGEERYDARAARVCASGLLRRARGCRRCVDRRLALRAGWPERSRAACGRRRVWRSTSSPWAVIRLRLSMLESASSRFFAPNRISSGSTLPARTAGGAWPRAAAGRSGCRAARPGAAARGSCARRGATQPAGRARRRASWPRRGAGRANRAQHGRARACLQLCVLGAQRRGRLRRPGEAERGAARTTRAMAANESKRRRGVCACPSTRRDRTMPREGNSRTRRIVCVLTRFRQFNRAGVRKAC